MPTYEYHARNKAGKRVHGQRLAQSSALLGMQLLKEGITPVTITAYHEEGGFFTTFKKWLPRNTITSDEMAIFSRQMHALLKTGVPVSVALRQLAENARSRELSSVLNSLVERLESGRTLSAAMQDFPDIFKPLMVSMVRVGEAGGRLDDLFMRLSHYIDLETETLKKAKSAMRYPLFVLLAMSVAFIVVTGWVIPTFANVFQDAHVQLPLLTRVLLRVSQSVTHYAIWFLVLLGLIVGGVVYYLRSPKGQYQWGKLQFHLPLLGNILRRIVLLRFAQTFSIVSACGISLIEGITLSAGVTENAYARTEILGLRQSIERGLNLASSIAGSTLFTSLEVQMIGISEETGQLVEMLEQVAAYYQREVEFDLKRLSDLIEPVVMAVLAILVGILAFSVYLPIWDMVNIVNK